jgi:predicted DNA-binding protein (UPF0251 family)
MESKPVTKRRSVKLIPDELKALKAYRKQFDTEVECAESIGIKREVLGRVMLLGSGSPETIDKIRAVISVEGTTE